MGPGAHTTLPETRMESTLNWHSRLRECWSLEPKPEGMNSEVVLFH